MRLIVFPLFRYEECRTYLFTNMFVPDTRTRDEGVRGLWTQHLCLHSAQNKTCWVQSSAVVHLNNAIKDICEILIFNRVLSAFWIRLLSWMRPYEVWRKGLLYSWTTCLLSYPWQNKQHLPGDLCSVHWFRSSGPGAGTCPWTPLRPRSRTCPGCPSREGETAPCPHPCPRCHSCSQSLSLSALRIKHSVGSHISISNRFLESRFPFSISRILVDTDHDTWPLLGFIHTKHDGSLGARPVFTNVWGRDLCLPWSERLLLRPSSHLSDSRLAWLPVPGSQSGPGCLSLPGTGHRPRVGEERRRVYRQLLPCSNPSLLPPHLGLAKASTSRPPLHWLC